MNTHENDTQAELAAWEILAETRTKLDAVTEQLDRLTEVLKGVIGVRWQASVDYGKHQDWCDAYDVAKHALQSLTNPEPKEL